MLEIFAIDQNGNREQITDLYWFEENGIHDWDEDGVTGIYWFQVYVSGNLIWQSASQIRYPSKQYILEGTANE